MKKNSRNSDLLDTMELPVIRPKPVKEDKYSYDGSYDEYNDPENKLARKIEKRLKNQHVPNASAKKKHSTSYCESAKRPSTPSYQSYGTPYVEDSGPASSADYYEDGNTIDTRAIVTIVMAIIFLAIGAIIFFVIATNFGHDRSANTPAHDPRVPGYLVTTAVTEETTVAPQETTEVTTEATTEATTTQETTTETTTEQTTEQTTELTTEAPATQMPTESQTEAPVITQPEVIVTNPPAPTETQTQPEPETEAPTEECMPSDIQDLDPATPGIQGAW